MKISQNSGQASKRTFNKRNWLVEKGLASWFHLYLTEEELEKRLTL